MTTLQAVSLGIPRWMALSHLSQDAEQIVALVNLEYHTPAQRQTALAYYLRCLRRDQWERRPLKPVKKPAALRPSKRASGYRHNPEMHRASRQKVPRVKRILIASAGGYARKEAHGTYGT